MCDDKPVVARDPPIVTSATEGAIMAVQSRVVLEPPAQGIVAQATSFLRDALGTA